MLLDENADPEDVPDEIRDLPVEALDIPVRPREALARAGIVTVGELHEAVQAGSLESIRGMGTAGAEAAVKALETALHDVAAVTGAAEPEYPAHLIEVDPDEHPPDLVRLIAPLAKTVVETKRMPHPGISHYEVLRGRFGLEGSGRYTLAELGSALGVTRQRVQQIEARSLQQVRSALLPSGPPMAHTAPGPVVEEARAMKQMLVDGGPVWRHDGIASLLSRRYGRDDVSPLAGNAALLLSVLGVTDHRMDGTASLGDRIWCADDPTFSLSEFKQANRAILQHLRRHDDPVASFDLRVAINSRRKKPLADRYIRSALLLCDAVSLVEPDQYQLQFAHLTSHARRAYRVLRDAGHPMHLRDLVHEVNRRLVSAGKRPVTKRSVQTQIVSDDRIRPAQRGYWTLAAWNEKPPIPTGQLLRDYFLLRQSPATVDEIMEYAAEVRPFLSRGAVQTYLSANREFRRVTATQWQLASWGGATYEARRHFTRHDWADHIAAAIRELTAETGAPVPMRRLVAALEARTDRATSTCRKVIVTSPIVHRTGTGQNTSVALVADDDESLERLVREWTLSKAPARKEIEDTVIEFLAGYADGRAPLGLVVNHVEQSGGRPRSTIYSYISTMDSVKKVRDGEVTMLVRLDRRSTGNT